MPRQQPGRDGIYATLPGRWLKQSPGEQGRYGMGLPGWRLMLKPEWRPMLQPGWAGQGPSSSERPGTKLTPGRVRLLLGRALAGASPWAGQGSPPGRAEVEAPSGTMTTLLPRQAGEAVAEGAEKKFRPGRVGALPFVLARSGTQTMEVGPQTASAGAEGQ